VTTSSTPPLLIVAASVLGATLATPARADILPPNLRQCEGAQEGQPCQTDTCAPGTCRTTGIQCKHTSPDCLLCTLTHTAPCDEVCKVTRAPCVLCVPREPSLEAKRRFDRWDDCRDKREGDTCKTIACDDGVCALPECNEAPCAPSQLSCLVPPPSSLPRRLALGGGGALAVALGSLAAVRARRRRRGKLGRRVS
jgi:hypothetical protein